MSTCMKLYMHGALHGIPRETCVKFSLMMNFEALQASMLYIHCYIISLLLCPKYANLFVQFQHYSALMIFAG